MYDLYFIVGINYAECQYYIRKKYEDPEFAKKYPRKSSVVAIYEPEQVKGYTIHHGSFCGRWKENPKMMEILQIMLMSAGTEASSKIREVYEYYWKEIQ